jgi:hypothetical protein
LYLVDLYHIGVDCLEAVNRLKLICLSFYSTGVHQFLIQGAVFAIFMGRSLLIRDWKLVSNEISMGRELVSGS